MSTILLADVVILSMSTVYRCARGTLVYTVDMNYDGLQIDVRSSSEKEKDYFAVEIYSPEEVKPQWRAVQENGWRKYQVRSQDGSGSCVANTVAKMLEVKRKLAQGDDVKFSHAPIYINRSNKPSAGMIGVNALELGCKLGSCKEEDFPSENKNDAQLDVLKLPANFEMLNNLVKPSNYLVLPRNFDYVAGVVLKEGCAMLWFESDYESWNKDIPTPNAKKRGEVRHSVTAVDAVMVGDVQYIVIEDSWGKFGKYEGQRLITREMFNDAILFAATFTDFQYNIQETVIYPFSNVMVFGEKSVDVERLQEFLKGKGFFPAIKPTGYYGNVTRKAVYYFQMTNKVASSAELAALAGKRVGAKTLAAINAQL